VIHTDRQRRDVPLLRRHRLQRIGSALDHLAVVRGDDDRADLVSRAEARLAACQLAVLIADEQSQLLERPERRSRLARGNLGHQLFGDPLRILREIRPGRELTHDRVVPAREIFEERPLELAGSAKSTVRAHALERTIALGDGLCLSEGNEIRKERRL
jgi:hypothetical protein